MHFLVSVQHKTDWFTYVVKAEPDGIFIAWPQKKDRLGEKIFLVKTNQRWVGDAGDKLLVRRIGRQIENYPHHLSKSGKPAGTGRQRPAVTSPHRKAKPAAMNKASKETN